MSEKEIDVQDMQCWVFRLAQTRWKISENECAKLFKDNDIWKFIEDCYDVLHLNSYNCVVNDVETLLKNKGLNTVTSDDKIQSNESKDTKIYNATQRKIEAYAVILMRDTVQSLADQEKISYKDALFLFTSSNVYKSLFDFDTGMWKKSPEYLLNLYNQILDKRQ